MIDKILKSQADTAYALLRIVSGLMFSFHGMQKIFGVLSKFQPPVFSQLWFGGIIEVVGGLFIAAGLFTTCAALVASGTMAVAYVQFHWKLATDSKFFPAINQGELAVLYCFVFLFIACRGTVKWGVRK